MSDQRKKHKIFIGFDAAQALDFAVAVRSIKDHASSPIDIHGLSMESVRLAGLYTRPTLGNSKAGLFDVISQAPMSTGFAIARFLTPILAEHEGLALFMDCDQMFRDDPIEVFNLVNPDKAVTCVKHEQHIAEFIKKTGNIQQSYNRKNWSSFMLFNCEHPANRNLTVELINTATGLDLHRFCWLADEDIGEFPRGWNHLVGHDLVDPNNQPKHVHWTLGSPSTSGYEYSDFADEYRSCVNKWVENPL